ncbi:uncharacterized protein P174DRAFT_457636 [Aspergillus novofumigatus IBT 16806]|uniref:Uncharacterized protein n=1 Tax=Aspergillus novofumigatus (strain IBT 16806) TaxID=1392255 RepID=A0A2I1CGZ3_ASPN1|nr:uncharacterized protein P174DRAFT_457636 [Aspergillus novofumigatus IBT 16806]PKX96893.1 hypothetical protein P174DRAFT_457636 [Aspergillus novofumigatus IBT 16806]
MYSNAVIGNETSSGLNSCPAEILHLVFQLLSSAELHALCLPFLYAYNPPVTQFLRSIVHRLELTSFIHHNYKQKSPKLLVTEVVLDELLPSLRCFHLDCHLPSFIHLQDVSAVYPDLGLNIRKYIDVRNMADVLPLFYLPLVEWIKALINNPATFIWPGKYLLNLLRLTSLNLTMLREGHLSQVLLDWYYRPDLKDHFITDIINLDKIAADLSHVQETLIDLTITARLDLTFSGSFKTFSRLYMLKRLEVPLLFLRGFSQSALNVREWEWDCETEYLLGAICSWLQDWKRSTPCLQGFRLLTKEIPVRDWGFDPVMIQALRDIGAQTGIQVQIIEGEGVE